MKSISLREKLLKPKIIVLKQGGWELKYHTLKSQVDLLTRKRKRPLIKKLIITWKQNCFVALTVWNVNVFVTIWAPNFLSVKISSYFFMKINFVLSLSEIKCKIFLNGSKERYRAKTDEPILICFFFEILYNGECFQLRLKYKFRVPCLISTRKELISKSCAGFDWNITSFKEK